MSALPSTLLTDLCDGSQAPTVTSALEILDGGDIEATAKSALERASHVTRDDVRVVVVFPTRLEDPGLARFRNGIWPQLHVPRFYRLAAGRPIQRIDVEGKTELTGNSDREATVVFAVRRAYAMSPAFTQVKFDKKASGWNGVPGSPSYPHFRWMRRLLSDLGPPRPGEHVLDAGSGAGWVGIEAGLKAKLGRLCAFDPSSEMTKFVVQNAKDNGLEIDARVGFVEEPPFQEQFDLVYNSGVISFAPDPQRFLDGIDRVVKPGGRLIIGDLNPNSSGFRRRRRERPLLPTRELHGVPRAQIVKWLEARGYRVDFVRFYQLTYPIPEIAHQTNSHLIGRVLLAANQILTGLDAMMGSPLESLFDSWIVGATRKPR